MVQIRQEALEYELRRWMRPDWRKSWTSAGKGNPVYNMYEGLERKFSPDQPRVPAGVPECGQWAGENGRSPDGGRRRSTAGSGSEMLGRAPRRAPSLRPSAVGDGQPKRKAELTSASGAVEKEMQIAGRISPQRRAEREEQYRLNTFICNTLRTRSCWAQAEFRYSQCLIGAYVPPIYH